MWPRRWVFHRIKRSLLLLTLLTTILAFASGIFFLLRSEGAQTLAAMVAMRADGRSAQSAAAGIVQYFPDNQNKYLFRKEGAKQQQQEEEDLTENRADRGGKYEEVLKQALLSADVGESSSSNNSDLSVISYDVHLFYYAWYASPLAGDDQYQHWNHKYLPNWDKNDDRVYPVGSHDPAKDDIGSNFFPQLGCYGSRDAAVLADHMRQVRFSGAGVIVVSWYPPGMADENGPPSDEAIPALLEAAKEHGVKVALHVEPYQGQNVTNLRKNLEYVHGRYSSHPAFYKRRVGERRLPVLYLYDSYRISPSEWQRLLSRRGDLTVRGTDLDAVFLGLLVEFRHRSDVKKSKFDGFYTYFAANGFSHGSSWKNWKGLHDFARRNSLLFVPSVGPGYVDVRIRPWNGQTTRERRGGAYYGLGWRTALGLSPAMVSVTSFNEWGEGTQIETAAAEKRTKDGKFGYLSYLPNAPDFYLAETRRWVDKFKALSDRS